MARVDACAELGTGAGADGGPRTMAADAHQADPAATDSVFGLPEVGRPLPVRRDARGLIPVVLDLRGTRRGPRGSQDDDGDAQGGAGDPRSSLHHPLAAPRREATMTAAASILRRVLSYEGAILHWMRSGQDEHGIPGRVPSDVGGLYREGSRGRSLLNIDGVGYWMLLQDLADAVEVDQFAGEWIAELRNAVVKVGVEVPELGADPCTLGVQYRDGTSERFRRSDEAMLMLIIDSFLDFPREGPRATRWLVVGIDKTGIAPIALSAR